MHYYQYDIIRMCIIVLVLLCICRLGLVLGVELYHIRSLRAQWGF